ncbi:zinc-binding dehydrogenase [Marinobacterium lacunae]|uniref:zinc-binding dehydrogenase n=1 Tax=Marinobacterium lacunae TaxID=1232683 RepID=UPI0018CC1E5A|nr:zinc-binding dehydrogenase [Marinobacterium lacunae]
MTISPDTSGWLGPCQLHCRVVGILAPKLLSSGAPCPVVAVVLQAGAEAQLPAHSYVAFSMNGPVCGDERVVDEHYVVPVADSRTEQALMAYVWPSLYHGFEHLALAPSATVMIHRADSPLGLLNTLLALQRGAQVFALTRHRQSAYQLMQLGAAEAALYGTDWAALAREHGGVDAVLDPTSGVYAAQSLQALRRYGRVLMLGLEPGQGRAIDPLELRERNTGIAAVRWDPMRDRIGLESARPSFELLIDRIQQLPLTAAHRYEV